MIKLNYFVKDGFMLKSVIFSVAVLFSFGELAAQKWEKINAIFRTQEGTPKFKEFKPSNSNGFQVQGEQPFLGISQRREELFSEPISSKMAATVATNGTYECIVYFTKEALNNSATRQTIISKWKAKRAEINSVYDQFFTARLSLKEMESLSEEESILFIDNPELQSLHRMKDDLSIPESGAAYLRDIGLNGTKFTGKGVIILVIDTGIDFKHYDFRNPVDKNKTRILAIWDQTLTPVAGENSPIGFTYGVEYLQEDLNGAIAGTKSVRTQDTDGHGTHVAGTAAGNGLGYASTQGNDVLRRFMGMAPEADIVAVQSFSGPTTTQTRLIDAITYARLISQRFGKPVVVNMSLGSILGPKDGKDPVSSAINSFAKSGPGRMVAISAGNSGNDSLHLGKNLSANETAQIQFQVPPPTNGGTHSGNFSVDVWVETNESFSATLTTPSGRTVLIPNSSNTTAAGTQEGVIQIFNNVYPPNNHREIYFSIENPTVGDWSLSFTVPSATRFDAYRSNSGTVRARVIGGDVSQSMAGGQAASEEGITVGSYQTRWIWPSIDGGNYTVSGSSDRRGNISTFSSLGPTRNGAPKPDISAPGEMIVSAFSSLASAPQSNIVAGGKHRVLRGTSMSCPHVAGALALLLQANPNRMSEEVKATLLQTANKDNFTTLSYNVTWGHGKLDAAEGVAQTLNSSAKLSLFTISYTATRGIPTRQFPLGRISGSAFVPDGLGLWFTAPEKSQLIGFTVDIERLSAIPLGTLVAEVYRNSTQRGLNLPGQFVGKVETPLALLSRRTRQFVSFHENPISFDSTGSYHLALKLSLPLSDSIGIGGDDGRYSQRSLILNGGTWYNFSEPESGLSSSFSFSNLHIRPIVATAENVTGTPIDNEQTIKPDVFELGQNYPNPFNPTTTIPILIRDLTDVDVELYDVVGRKIAVLIRESNKPPGFYLYQLNLSRFGLSTGVYIYRMKAGNAVQVKKMLYLK
ncbi:MAG: S8/S53 family peptidase [Chloroherpetonaceae bacterium]|nr:S8/S53 family peptidase [Chloroherpetonaceae bacterium]